ISNVLSSFRWTTADRDDPSLVAGLSLTIISRFEMLPGQAGTCRRLPKPICFPELGVVGEPNKSVAPNPMGKFAFAAYEGQRIHCLSTASDSGAVPHSGG